MPTRTCLSFADTVRTHLCRKKCWYVSCRSLGTTFQLALGRRVLRPEPLRNGRHPSDYRRYEGEANLLVWCTWRLDRGPTVLTSSDDEDRTVIRQLRGLTGRMIMDVVVDPPAHDLQIRFGGQHILRVFCDHVPGDPSYSANWYLAVPGGIYYAGPGTETGFDPSSCGIAPK